MYTHLRMVIASTWLVIGAAFLPGSFERSRHSISFHLEAQPSPSFLDNLPNIPNPFAALKTADFIPSVQSLDDDQAFEPSPAGLFRQARRVIAADMGIQEAGLLDENFKWFGPVVDEPLGKTDYLAAGRFFDLRSAFQDLDYRAHDFRLDEEDPATVRFTCRTTGTMRGQLRLRGEVLQPTGKRMICPPEAVTMTFDLGSGKVLKITSGFILDRLIGNTAGTTGVIAAAMVGGKPASDWELYPASTVFQRFFGRPTKQLPEPKTFLAPFPETVMIQLTKGILAANMASEDSSLLAKGFTYMTPTLGPIRKKQFLEKYAALEFEGVDPSFSHFRVDPFNPYVVWIDVRPTAPGYKGSPQAMSFTFDDDGFCTRVTSGAVIDPTIGNGGGLAGVEGLKYAMNSASPAVFTRPLPRVVGRLRRRVVGLFTRKDVDDYDLPKASGMPAELATPQEKLSSLRARSTDTALSSPESPKAVPSQPAKASKPADKPRTVQEQSSTKNSPLITLPKFDVQTKLATDQATPKPSSSTGIKITNAFSFSQAPSKISTSSKKPDVKKSKTDVVVKASALEAESKRKQAAAEKASSEKQRLEAQRTEAKRKLEESKRKQAEAAATQLKQREAAKAAAESARLKQEQQRQKEALAKQQAELRKKEAIAKQKEVSEAKRLAAEKKQKEIQAQGARQAVERAKEQALEKQKRANASLKQRKLEDKQKQTEEKILSKLSQVTSRATIGLFGLGTPAAEDEDETTATTKQPEAKLRNNAPFGVPTLSKWRKNFDGSITGVISGSSSFGDGEKVTTSAIAKGSITPGEVVVTASGSRYFLS